MKGGRKILIALIVFSSFSIFFFYFYNLIDTWNLSFELDSLPKSLKNLFIKDFHIKETENKFVRYTCHSYCGGFADRLKGIVAAYMWAKLTGRRFEIDMQYPCLLQIVLEPNKIDWRMESNSMVAQTSRNLTQVKIEVIDNQIFRNRMNQINILEFHKDADIIIIKNNLDWMLQFSQNLFLRERIKQLGYKVFKFKTPFIFKDVYRSLFKLSPHLMPRYIDFIKKAKLNDKTKLICVQIREYYAKRENSMLFWQFVEKTFLTQNDLKYKIFISTDMPDVHKEGIEFFGESNCVTFNGQFTHMDRGDVNFKDCQRIEKVILDFHALQNCDYAIISDSGFGKLGVYNRNHPDQNLYVFRNRNNEKEFVKMSMKDLIEFDPFF